MFNPTVIRLCNTETHTAMVVCNSIGDEIYFQVYEKRFNEKTFLSYACPWTYELGAIEAFENWVKENGALNSAFINTLEKKRNLSKHREDLDDWTAANTDNPTLSDAATRRSFYHMGVRHGLTQARNLFYKLIGE